MPHCFPVSPHAAPPTASLCRRRSWFPTGRWPSCPGWSSRSRAARSWRFPNRREWCRIESGACPGRARPPETHPNRRAGPGPPWSPGCPRQARPQSGHRRLSWRRRPMSAASAATPRRVRCSLRANEPVRRRTATAAGRPAWLNPAAWCSCHLHPRSRVASRSTSDPHLRRPHKRETRLPPCPRRGRAPSRKSESLAGSPAPPSLAWRHPSVPTQPGPRRPSRVPRGQCRATVCPWSEDLFSWCACGPLFFPRSEMKTKLGKKGAWRIRARCKGRRNNDWSRRFPDSPLEVWWASLCASFPQNSIQFGTREMPTQNEAERPRAQAVGTGLRGVIKLRGAPEPALSLPKGPSSVSDPGVP